MPQIKKILFPVDFSTSCQGVARYVEAFAGRFEAEIMLLHCEGKGEDESSTLNAFLADELKHFTTQRQCVSGDAATRIEETARRWQPDLLMMSTHGAGLFRRLLLGSVSAKVLHDLNCPVWTAVHAETAPPLEQIHCRRVLCALGAPDFGDHGPDALAWAVWLAAEYQAEVGIVHATPALPPSEYGLEFEAELTNAALVSTKTRVAALQASAGIEGPVYIEAGHRAQVAANAARRFGADLLVTGRHGGTRIVRESPCPVVTV